MDQQGNSRTIDGFYCGGAWKPCSTDKSFPVVNPATSLRLGEVCDCGPEDVTAAIAAATEAFDAWSTTTPKERAALLHAVAAEMTAQSQNLAEIITAENGKPVREAEGEVAYAADFFTWYAEECKRAYGEIVPANVKKKWRLVLRQPIGPVAIISPWNFPLAMLTRKLAPALGAGCTAVIKPAEQTPMCAIELFRIMDAARFPAGVVNLVCTSEPAPVGRALLQSVDIRMLTFTGSDTVGKEIIRLSAEHATKLALEHGGNAACVVYADADLDVATEGLMACKFRCGGQTCICANRIFVHERVAEEFLARLKPAVESLRVGDGSDESTDIGPLIDQAGLVKVEGHVQDALAKGARCLCGGQRRFVDSNESTYFYKPTILTGINASMKILQEETFGPIIPVVTFSDSDDILAEVNRTRFGLAAYAYTRSLSTALRFAERVEAGVVGINDAIPSVPECPFGGFKESGIGREGGWRGLDEFLETKYVSVSL